MGGSALSRLKLLAGFGGGTEPPYRCQGCEAAFEVQYHVCPECGGYSVEADAGGPAEGQSS